jgi:quinol monooxygenase YgiN
LEEQKEALYKLVEERWMNEQDLEAIRQSNHIYAVMKSTDGLVALVREQFRKANYSKIVYGKEQDITRLSLES